MYSFDKLLYLDFFFFFGVATHEVIITIIINPSICNSVLKEYSLVLGRIKPN